MNYIKNNKVLLLVIAALIVVNLGLLYYGFIHKDPRRTPMTPEERMAHAKEKLKNEVGFSDGQADKYIELRKKHFEAIHPMFEELEKSKENYLNLIYQSNLTDSSIQSGAEKICEKQRAIDEQMLRHFISVRQLATEEQKPKMDSLLQRIIQKMTGHGPGPSKEKQ